MCRKPGSRQLLQGGGMVSAGSDGPQPGDLISFWVEVKYAIVYLCILQLCICIYGRQHTTRPRGVVSAGFVGTPGRPGVYLWSVFVN